ncbi:unnamed protein product [Rotaria magnacalcarata]
MGYFLKKQIRSTTNLRRQLDNVHSRTELMYNCQRKKCQEKPSLISPDFKKQLDTKLIDAVIVDSRPFGDFSRPGLKGFLAVAIPNYKLLHRTTIHKRHHLMYKKHGLEVRNVLSKIKHIALTVDMWKKSRGRHFISLTGHLYDNQLKLISITLGFRLVRGRHLADRLKKFIQQEITFYKLNDKVLSITSNNATNIVNAIHDLNIGTHHSCMGHNLNFMVKSTILSSKKTNKKLLSSTVSKGIFDNNLDSQSESTSESESDTGSCSTSEVNEEEEHDLASTSLEDENNKDETSDSQLSNDESDSITSSEDDDNLNFTKTNVLIEPTLQLIRSLIKQVRELVGLVRKSSNLNDYVRHQSRAKKLPGDVCDKFQAIKMVV